MYQQPPPPTFGPTVSLLGGYNEPMPGSPQFSLDVRRTLSAFNDDPPTPGGLFDGLDISGRVYAKHALPPEPLLPHWLQPHLFLACLWCCCSSIFGALSRVLCPFEEHRPYELDDHGDVILPPGESCRFFLVSLQVLAVFTVIITSIVWISVAVPLHDDTEGVRITNLVCGSIIGGFVLLWLLASLVRAIPSCPARIVMCANHCTI